MRADRLLALLMTLQTKRRITAAELAVQLEVSERTIYRDIEALSMAGIPVYTQTGPSGGVFLEEGYRSSLTRLTVGEIQSLVLVADHPQLYDLGLTHVSEQTLLKLLTTLPSVQRDEAERMRERFYIDPVNWFRRDKSDDCLPLLQQTVWENRSVRFVYQRRDGELSKRYVQPYGLVAKSQMWYLVGLDNETEMKTFRVSRIHNLTLCENRFERRENFDLVDYWTQSSQEYQQGFEPSIVPMTVVVRIDPTVRWFFTTSLPNRHTELDREEAGGWITLAVDFESTISARIFVLGLGDQIEVLQPADFRDEITQTLRRSLKRYEG